MTAGGAPLGLAAAVLASAGYGAGSVLQAVGARRAAGTGAAGGLLRQPAYLAGVGLDGVAWVVSLAALRVLPLFAVQALLAGSLAVTAVLGSRVLRLPLGGSGRAAVAAAVVGLAVVAAGARPDRPAPLPPGAGVASLVISAVLLALALVPEPRRRAVRGTGRAVAWATAAGLAYTLAAVCARAVRAGSPVELLAQPAAWSVVLAGVAGTLLYGRSLAGDGLVVATALLWVVEVAAGSLAGWALLGDGARPGWALPSAAGVLVALAACALLARPAAARGEAGPA